MSEQEKPDIPRPIEDPCIVPPDWTLAQRLNYVRTQVGYLQKEKEVQGYKVVTHDQVTGHLRKYLTEAGVFIIPSVDKCESVLTGTKTGNGTPFIRLETIWTITVTHDFSDKNSFGMQVPAHALDHGDKAPGKAESYAMKYAMLKLFNIETGEDEESRVEQKAAEELEAEKEKLRRERLSAAVANHMDSIVVIKTGIKEDDLSTAAEAWFELSDDEKRSIWAAPSSGGPFSTDERKIIKSREFRIAHYGEAHVAAEEEVKAKAKEVK